MGVLELGLMNTKVTVQKRTSTSDGQGGHDWVWSTRCTLWAEVLPLSGIEAQQARELNAVMTTQLMTHYRSDVLVKDRIVYGDRTFEIDSVQDVDGRREAMKLLCREVQL